MNYRIKDIPKEERPRERLKEVGIENISNKELISIILKTGTKNKNVNEISLEILNKYNPIKRPKSEWFNEYRRSGWG